MTTNTMTQTPTTSDPTHPGALRRTAVAVTGFLAAALPVIFAINISRDLLTGTDPSHRFHQATGQGLLLCALWLVPVLGLIRAGWSGRRPSSAAGWQHLALIGAGTASSLVSPAGGSRALMAVIAVPGALLWLALPKQPRLRGSVQLHPVLAPLALLTTAWLAPYAVDQLRLQNAVTSGLHAENPHLWDMAWVSTTLMLTALLAATLPQVRHLFGWVAGGTLVLGAAGLAFGEPTTWSAVTLALGAVSAVAVLAGRRGREV